MVRLFLPVIALAWMLPSPVASQERTDAVGDPLPPGIRYRLGSTRLRHWLPVGLNFTPDGKRLFSVGDDDCREWDVATGKLLRSRPRHTFPLAFSRDARHCVSWIDKELRVQETAHGKLLHTFSLEKLQDVLFAADQKTLVALTQDDWVVRWDLTTGKELGRRQFELVKREYWVDPPARLSPDGRMLAGVHQRDRPHNRDTTHKTIPLHLWDVASGDEVHKALPVARSYYDCRWSPDGSQVFALVLPYGLEIWDVATGKRVERKEEPGVKGTKIEVTVGDPKTGEEGKVAARPQLSAEIVELTPDGQNLLLAMFGQLACYDLKAGKTRWHRSVTPKSSGPGLKLSTIISFAFHTPSKTVAVGSQCGHIALIDWTTGKDVSFSSQHPGFFNGPVFFSKDGSRMFVRDAVTERLALHDPRTGKRLRSLGRVGDSAWSADGKRYTDFEGSVLNDDEPKYLVLKELDSGKVLWKIRGWAYEEWFTDDGKSLVYFDLDKRTIHRVSAETGAEEYVSPVPAETMSRDGTLVAAKAKKELDKGSSRPRWRELQVWSVEGNKLWSWQVPDDWRDSWRLQFLPDSKNLVVDGYSEEKSSGGLYIFDAATGKSRHELPVKWRNAFDRSSPDGRILVVNGEKQLEFRDVATAQLLFAYASSGMRGYLHNIAFAPDGSRCALCTDDYTVEVRELRSGKLLNKFHRPTYFFRNNTFAPDSRTLAMTFNDATIWMWDTDAKMD